MIRHPFQGADGAARYAAGRPYVHPLFMARLHPWLSGTTLGADVACGTGMGSVALAELVDRVLAFDVSEAMLARAIPHPRVIYAQAPAENLPLPDACLDALTVAQGLHWFDRPAFFAEARRTLKRGGVLCIYDMFFRAELEGQPTFSEQRFPHVQAFNRAELVAYLVTHSNTVVASDEGRESPQSISAWLNTELEPFLPGGTVGQFAFGGLLRVLT